MNDLARPRITLRAEIAEAQTLWICRTSDEAMTEDRAVLDRVSPWYVAASSVQKRTGYRNTSRLEEAARFTTREAAENARPLGDATGGQPYAHGEERDPTKPPPAVRYKLFCFKPNRWGSYEAPVAAYVSPPEPECSECGGVRGPGVCFGHLRPDCGTLREDRRRYEAERTTRTATP